jgi:hypothetical protein
MPVIKNTIYEVPQKIKTELPGEQEIPVLGIYLQECKQGYKKDRCTPIFITTLFITAKLWNDTKCPTTDE